MDEKVILAYASQYKEKYFFNDELGKLPQTVRNEALMCLIMIVEEAGGVAELGFYPDGEYMKQIWNYRKRAWLFTHGET